MLGPVFGLGCARTMVQFEYLFNKTVGIFLTSRWGFPRICTLNGVLPFQQKWRGGHSISLEHFVWVFRFMPQNWPHYWHFQHFSPKQVLESVILRIRDFHVLFLAIYFCVQLFWEQKPEFPSLIFYMPFIISILNKKEGLNLKHHILQFFFKMWPTSME